MAGQGEMLITMDVPESTARGLFVDGSGALSATNKAVGCLVEGTDAGEVKASVQVGGTALGVFGATITAGQSLQADADGNLIVAVADGLICAIALEGGADGELRTVLIR